MLKIRLYFNASSGEGDSVNTRPSPNSVSQVFENATCTLECTSAKKRTIKTERQTLRRRLKSIPREHRARLEAVIHSGEPIPRISPHDLRHTAGTLMLRRGVPIEVVSKTLGHSDIALTYRVYRHVLESEKRQHIVDLFDTPLPDRTVRSVPVN
jgi:integrase